MPSFDSAPYNGDNKLGGPESRAYFLYGWGEIRANREPAGVEQAQANTTLQPQDSRSPYRVYADTLMTEVVSQLSDPLTIIDIGCGKGAYAELFAAHQGEYHGVDAFDYPQWGEVEHAYQNSPLKVKFHHLAGEKLAELSALTANFSLSSSALEHVDDPDAVITGLAACCPAGALGLHIVPAPWSLITYGKHGWRRFSAERLKSLFEEAGFEVVKIYRLGGLPSTFITFLWITALESGAWLQSLTLSALPFILYRANSVLSIHRARTYPVLNPLYRWGLRLALRLDRYLPYTAQGYAVLVRRKIG